MRDFALRLILLGRVFDAVPRFKELVRYLSPHFFGDALGLHVSLQLGHDLEARWFQDDHMQDLSRKYEDERIRKLLVGGFKFSGAFSQLCGTSDRGNPEKPILDRLRDRWQECHCWKWTPRRRQAGYRSCQRANSLGGV